MSKPFIERLTLDEANLKIIKENRQKIGGFAIFKSSFLGQIWNNVKTNWLMLAFCIPILAWIVYSQIGFITAYTNTPYDGNIGIGFPVVPDAALIGAEQIYSLSMNRALFMLPLIVIASVGLAGVFNVIKYFTWGFKIKIVKTFFRGIKNSFAPFIWVGTMLGLCYLMLTFVFTGLDYFGVGLGLKIAAYSVSILICYFVILISVFITTQASVFDLTLRQILKNSLLLGSRFILQNSLIAVIGLISMLLPFLTFNSWLLIGAYTVFFMMAFSYTATVWTIYAQYLFDMMYEGNAKKESHRAKNAANQPQIKAVVSSQQSKNPNRAKPANESADNKAGNNLTNNDLSDASYNQSENSVSQNGRSDKYSYNKSTSNYSKKYHNPKKKKK